jgi:hypothetical protein
MFAPLPAERVGPTDIDAGMAERGPLEIDADGTLDRLATLLSRSDAILAAEAAAVERIRPGLIVADIPFLAGDVAAAADVPCVAVSNFTWDWICDPLLSRRPGYAAVRKRMIEGYGKMAAVLQLPFGDVSEGFRRRIPVPLIAGRSTRDPADVLARLGIDAGDGRPRVLVGLRGGVAPETLRAAAVGARDFLFLCPDRPGGEMPDNVRAVLPAAGVDFADLVAVSAVVVSKLGYGIVSDCLAAGTALLWPRRTGFREDEVVEAEGPRFMRMCELPAADFAAGAWAGWLRRAHDTPPPAEALPTDGAEFCANLLLRLASGEPP